ncbi:MAG: hypothetical protein EOP81_09405 [Variovorax sp.]|nr:MAG: hypothetical protein EOP81_09405 [Variovorax sp.]
MTSSITLARWPAPVATALLWALAAASAAFWGLRLAAPAEGMAPAAAATRAPVVADPGAVARLLGAVSAPTATAAAPEAASRFALSGVIADGANQGAALIAIDGKPPRPFRVGGRVGEGYVLQSVGLRSATLGASAGGAAAFTLDLPVRAPIPVSAPVPPPSGAPAS